MDGCGDSHRISVSLRNALSVNSVKNHELSKTVRSLEAKRDQELLCLQVQKDRVISSVPGINKAVTKLSGAASERLHTAQFSDPGSSSTLLTRAHSLPPLNPIGTSPRLRRADTLQQEQAHPVPAPPASPRPRRAASIQQPNVMSPPCSPTQALSSPQVSRKFFNRQLSSPGMMLANSMTSLRDISHSEETLECQHRFSPRGRSSAAGALPSNITAALSKFPEQGKPNTNSLSRPGTASDVEKGVHRGLHLRPISSSVTEQKKPKDKTKTTVFSRLYKNAKQAGGKSSPSRRMDSAGSKRLSARRRSISMPDLSEMMDNLKTCRYLRSSDQKDSDDEIKEDSASNVEN